MIITALWIYNDLKINKSDKFYDYFPIYSYVVDARVIYDDLGFKEITLSGSIAIGNTNGNWEIVNFEPDLRKLIQVIHKG